MGTCVIVFRRIRTFLGRTVYLCFVFIVRCFLTELYMEHVNFGGAICQGGGVRIKDIIFSENILLSLWLVIVIKFHSVHIYSCC